MRVWKRLRGGSLLGGVSVSFGMRMTDMALGYALSVALARFLGVESFGLYSFALSAITLLALPARFGLPPLIVRETSKALAAGEDGRLFAIKRWAYARVLSVSLPVIALALLAMVLFPEKIGQQESAILLAGIALVALFPIAEIRSALLRGLNQIAKSQLANSIVRPLVMLPMVGALILADWFGHQSAVDPAVLVMAMNVVATIIAWIVGSILLKRVLSGRDAGDDRRFEVTGWKASILALGLANGMYVIDGQLGIMLLGVFSDNAQIGLYKVAMQGATLVALGYAATNTPLTPRIARAWAEGRHEEVRSLARRGARFSIAFAAPLALVFLFAGEPLIRLVFGDEYAGAALPLAILTFGQLVNCAFGSATALLNMTHHEKWNTGAFGAAMVVNVVLAVALVPHFGGTGAAISAAISVVLRNCLLWLAARKLTGIDTGFWARI